MSPATTTTNVTTATRRPLRAAATEGRQALVRAGHFEAGTRRAAGKPSRSCAQALTLAPAGASLGHVLSANASQPAALAPAPPLDEGDSRKVQQPVTAVNTLRRPQVISETRMSADAIGLVGMSHLMELTQGRDDVLVGLVDGPVALDHPDLVSENIR